MKNIIYYGYLCKLIFLWAKLKEQNLGKGLFRLPNMYIILWQFIIMDTHYTLDILYVSPITIN